jgi:hypothetical protein
MIAAFLRIRSWTTDLTDGCELAYHGLVDKGFISVERHSPGLLPILCLSKVNVESEVLRLIISHGGIQKHLHLH